MKQHPVQYDSDNPEFYRGREIGDLETKLELLGNVAISQVMLQSNAAMVRLIAKAVGRPCAIEPIDETWVQVTLDPRPPGLHLRVVDP